MQRIKVYLVIPCAALFASAICFSCAAAKVIPFAVRHGYRFEIDMKNAKEIKLVGSWNNWNTDAHTLHKWGSYYWLDIELARGRYEYFFQTSSGRFVPANAQETIDDGFGSRNAVAVIN